MINILSVMLVSLGFLVATLVALLVAPAYRKRAVRLTTEDIKRSMPLTEADIRADKDRIRAEYAIQLHEFERKLENASLDAARQSVEINRRDALISGLEGEIGKLKTSLDEHENARRVLEHTVMDRLPKVEHRLAEAKKLLFQRDREISILTQSAEKQGRALDEATQINTQQRDEIHRLNAAITTRVARNREGLGDSRFDGEVALRSEIEALRAKTRDQSQLITRLQTLLVRAGVSADSVTIRSVNGTAADGGAHDSEFVRLRSDLSDAESALRSSQSPAGASQSQTGTAIEAELRALKSENRDQAAEVARLKAALATFEAGEKDERGQAKDSKIAMKARLASMHAENETQAVTIQSLRAEIAGTNERLARQAAHFRDEMRRIGAGTLPASGDARRTSYEEPPRRSLTDRINEPRPRIVGGAATSASVPAGTSAAVASRPAAVVAVAARPEAGHAAADSAVVPAAATTPADKPARRSRLLERLTGTETPGG
ncbi:MAG: hypothetical protein ABL908_10430 [Hyphomicrobium sp.]